MKRENSAIFVDFPRNQTTPHNSQTLTAFWGVSLLCSALALVPALSEGAVGGLLKIPTAVFYKQGVVNLIKDINAGTLAASAFEGDVYPAMPPWSGPTGATA